MDNGGTSSIFFGFFFADLLEVFGEGDFQTLLVMLIETVILESVEGDGRLEDIFEIDETQEILAPTHGGLLYETDALEAGEGTEDV